jgi:hypothetical protein
MENLGITELLIILAITLPFIILQTIGYWKLFEKAGKPGWAALVPIYNTIIILQIINKPWWWFLLMIIPFFGLIWAVWATNLFVKSYGKDVAYTIGFILLPFIFVPLLGFDKEAKYTQPESGFEAKSN